MDGELLATVWRVVLMICRYDAEGRNKQFTAYTNSTATRTDNNAAPRPDEMKTIGQAKDEQLGMSDKTDYFTSQATVSFVKSETFSYPACANPEGCNKKVMDDGSGWVCEKCDKKWPEPIHRCVSCTNLSNQLTRARYILQMNVMDHAGSIWITAFNEVAEQLMGLSANDIMKLKVSRPVRGLIQC